MYWPDSFLTRQRKAAGNRITEPAAFYIGAIVVVLEVSVDSPIWKIEKIQIKC